MQISAKRAMEKEERGMQGVCSLTKLVTIMPVVNNKVDKC